MPGSRYSDWSFVRIHGDQAAGEAHLPFARKMLGFLAEQRANGGARSQAIERTRQDGTVIRARFEGEYPIVEITPAKPPNAPGAPAGIKGFIVRPEGVATTYPEVVLVPTGEQWPARFYDPVDVPDPPPAKKGQYHLTPPQPLFPEGVRRFGNIDWRNADETLSVSWIGPQTRYFGTGQTACYVFCHGQILLDTRAVAPDLLGVPDPVVTGACLRLHPDHETDETPRGLWLYAVLMYSPTFGAYDYYLVRFPLAREPYDRRIPRSLFLRQEPRLQVGAGELVHTWSESSDYARMPHPWLFNQAGNVAKRMTVKLDQPCEQTLDVLDPTTPAYSESVTNPGTTITAHGLHDLSQQYAFPLGTFTSTDADGVTTTRDLALDEGMGHAIHAASLHYSASETPSLASVPIAVDWRDDAPVYAFGAIGSYSESRDYTISGSTTAVLTDHYTWDGGVVGGTATRTIDVWTRDESTTSGMSLSSSRLRAGLTVDWLAPLQATAAHTIARSIEHSIAIDKVADTEAHTVSASSNDVTATQDLYLWWLDLRYQLLSYSIRTTTVTVAIDADGSGTHPASEFGLFLPHSTSNSTVRTLQTRVLLGNVVLADSTVTLNNTTSSSSGTWRALDKCWTLAMSAPPATAYYEIGPFTASTDDFAGLMDQIAWSSTDLTSSTAATGTDTAAGSSTDTSALPDVATAGDIPTLTWIGVDETLPDSSTARHYGGWQTFEGAWCFSQGWPAAGGAAAWRNETSNGPIATVTALPTPDYFFPLTILPPVIVPAAP